MNGLWWLALPVLALPVWWHRQKREQRHALPLATARFLPKAPPHQVRIWRWTEILLLVLRCLLLATVIAWLANPVLPWRGDTVIVTPDLPAAWIDRQADAAQLGKAPRMVLPAAEVLGWIGRHEREWRGDARLLVLGDLPMPAVRPQFTRPVRIVARRQPQRPVTRHVAIVSERADAWKRLFMALGGVQPVVFDAAPGGDTELVVWDRAEAPPAAARAPLWWVTDARAFPALARARTLDGLRYADDPHGRLWWLEDGPPADADAARALVGNWQQLHLAPLPYATPSLTLAAGPSHGADADGALRDMLLGLAIALFVLERMLAHARRR